MPINNIRTLLIYSTLPFVGGNSTTTLTVAQEFRKQGWTVLVLTRHQANHGLSRDNIEWLEKIGCEVKVLTSNVGRYGFVTIQALIWVFQRGKNAVFITLCMGSASPFLSFIGRFRKSIFYLITHEQNPKTLNFLVKFKNLFTDFAVVSPVSTQPLKQLLGDECAITWLPQFSDFRSNNRQHVIRRKTEKLTFGFLGTLNSGKGVNLLIDLWPRLDGKADLHIAGDGPLKPDVEAAVISSGNRENQIAYVGAFSAAEREEFLDSFFRSIDYLIAPSANTNEGIPNVILEALSYGVPVLASNLGGTACFDLDWLKPTYPDVVHLFDLEKLSNAVSYFMAKGTPSEDYQQASIAYYQTWFSNEAILKRWLEVIN